MEFYIITIKTNCCIDDNKTIIFPNEEKAREHFASCLESIKGYVQEETDDTTLQDIQDLYNKTNIENVGSDEYKKEVNEIIEKWYNNALDNKSYYFTDEDKNDCTEVSLHIFELQDNEVTL